MDRSWNQLAERCNLFYDAPSGLYKELLKEAEVELANRCSLYKASISYNFANIQVEGKPQNSVQLPSTYKSMISVWFNGNEIPYREKHQWSFSKGTGGMTVQSGTPNYYDLANGFIFFDKAPSTSDVVDCYFRANMINDSNLDKSVMMQPKVVDDTGEGNYDQVSIQTSIGAELDGFGCGAIYHNNAGTLCRLSNLKFNSISNDSREPFDPGQYKLRTTSSETYYDLNRFALYKQIFDGGDGAGGDFENGVVADNVHKKGIITFYRKVGPVIENDYHLNLCDYAIYMASAKKNPELSMSHLQVWEQRLNQILNDNIDKELPMGMKEEI